LNMEGFIFRLASDNDTKWAISKLTADLSLSLGLEGYDIPMETYESMVAKVYSDIVSGPAPNALIVAESEQGERAGLVWVMRTRDENSGTDRAFVLDIHVDEPFRGQGLGAGLMERAEEWGREKGLSSIGLAVSEGNDGAIRLYRRLGYDTKRRIMMKTL